MDAPRSDKPKEGVPSVVKTTRKEVVLQAQGVYRVLAGVLAVAGTVGSVGLLWSAAAESNLQWLWLLLTVPITVFAGIATFQGRVCISLGERVETKSVS